MICRIVKAYIVFACLLVPLLSSATEKLTLVLNDTNEAPFTTEARDGFVDVIANEAFLRAGVSLKLVRLPAERGLINADAGIEDGDLSRIEGLEKLYPNLVRVPEKLVDWEFVAFAKDKNLEARWPIIREKVVGYITGWKIYEQQLQGAPHIVATNGSEQLFHLLDRGRVDIALFARWMGQAQIEKLHLKGIHQLQPELARREMFIYLNAKHTSLVPVLANNLRAMKQEGFYQRVQSEKLIPFYE